MRRYGSGEAKLPGQAFPQGLSTKLELLSIAPDGHPQAGRQQQGPDQLITHHSLIGRVPRMNTGMTTAAIVRSAAGALQEQSCLSFA